MTAADRTALLLLLQELEDRAASRQRPSDPVSLEAVEVLALVHAARALDAITETLDVLGTVRTPRAEAARTALRNLARLHRRPLTR